MTYKTYGVRRSDREPLLRFMLDALRGSGCRILQADEPDHAPFRFTFLTPTGERMGVIAYAFFANSKVTKNRPDDEHRFQIKYGSKDGKYHDLWQDPFQLYTTLLVGIDPERGIFVGADPVLHSPTRFFISLEFKRTQVDQILKRGWYSWERESRTPEHPQDPAGVEILVGGTAKSFLRFVRFERDAVGEDQGHRQLLAEADGTVIGGSASPVQGPLPGDTRLHALVNEFELSENEVLDLIANARRLKMAVRGWVAEEHLVRRLRTVRGVTECVRNDEEGAADVQLRFRGHPLSIECKNVLRKQTADGIARLDFQRTRAAKSDPCSRYYSVKDFDVVAACLHAVTQRWEFQYVLPGDLDRHPECRGKIGHRVKVDQRWSRDPVAVLSRLVA